MIQCVSTANDSNFTKYRKYVTVIISVGIASGIATSVITSQKTPCPCSHFENELSNRENNHTL